MKRSLGCAIIIVSGSLDRHEQPAVMNNDATSRRRWRLPIATWMASYERRWLPNDLLAGVTLAAYAIPVSLAYASLAGLPPHSGIYCY